MVVAPRPSRVAGAVLLVALVVGGAACNPGRPPAASVDDTHISATRVDDILAGLVDSDPRLRSEVAWTGADSFTDADCVAGASSEGSTEQTFGATCDLDESVASSDVGTFGMDCVVRGAAERADENVDADCTLRAEEASDDVSRADCDLRIKTQEGDEFLASCDVRGQVRGDGEDTFSSDWAANVLSLLTVRTITANEADDQGIDVSEADRTAGRADLAQVLTDEFAPTLQEDASWGEELLDAIPGETSDWLVDQAAKGVALQQSLVDVEARRYYDENTEQFLGYCLRAIVVAGDDADMVESRLADGEDFAELSAEVTIDEQLRAEGGDLGGCAPQQQLQEQFPPELYEPVVAAETGDVVGPVPFGEAADAVFMRVDDRRPVPFDDVQESIVTELQIDGSGELQRLVERQSGRADISVDPRFGSWSDDEGVVVPPAGSSEPGA